LNSIGERYAEFKQSDRVAEFGLAALIAGGAAALATKKGFWAIIAGFLAAAWKFVAAAVIGVLAWFIGYVVKDSRKSAPDRIAAAHVVDPV
jgi:uncharacterized membrane-anchored protein